MLDILLRLMRLFAGEFSLAKAEMARSARQAVIGVVLLVIAVVLAILALSLLTDALVSYLATQGLGKAWAPVVVALVYLLIATLLAWIGLRSANPTKIIPNRSLNGLRRDIAILFGRKEP